VFLRGSELTSGLLQCCADYRRRLTKSKKGTNQTLQPRNLRLCMPNQGRGRSERGVQQRDEKMSIFA